MSSEAYYNNLKALKDAEGDEKDKVANFLRVRVEYLLYVKNWTLYRLSKTAELPYSTLNNLMMGRGAIGVCTLLKITKALGVSLDEFFKPYYEIVL